MATEMKSEYGVESVRKEIEERFGMVPSWVEKIPDVALAGFWQIQRDLELGETAIPNKYKELIGIAVAGATRCRYCALFHTEAAKLFGATDEEIAEASMMAGLTMAASTLLNARQADYDVFRRETLEMVEYVRRRQQQMPTGAKGAETPTHA